MQRVLTAIAILSLHVLFYEKTIQDRSHIEGGRIVLWQRLFHFVYDAFAKAPIFTCSTTVAQLTPLLQVFRRRLYEPSTHGTEIADFLTPDPR